MLEITSHLSIMAEGVCHNLDISVSLMLGRYAHFGKLPGLWLPKVQKSWVRRVTRFMITESTEKLDWKEWI